MNTVVNNTTSIVIKNSKFICLVYNINSIDEVNKYLSYVREFYKDATHCCYAYILDDIKKESDDGEPSGTAGIPMMQVLEKKNLNRVLCIVVRYFGGIKLGAGGLVRAYTKSVVQCLDNHIKILDKGYNITIIFDYRSIKQIDYVLSNINILSKSFDNEITYNLNVTDDIIDKLKNINNIKIVINSEVYI